MMEDKYTYEPYLMHYGILGMKWGIRRYQPYSVRGRQDGRGGIELGEAKKASKRHSGDFLDDTAKAAEKRKSPEEKKAMLKALFEKSIKGGKDKPNVSPAEKIGSDAGSIVDNVGNIMRVTSKAHNAQNQYVKQLSDEELKKRIQRLELEKRFSDLSDDEIQRSKVTASDILSTVGSAVVIGKSVADIVSLYLKIKGVI